MSFLYCYIFKPVLFLFDPEKVHDVFVVLGRVCGESRLGKILVSFLYGYRGKDISVVVDGIKYRNPVVLAAGFDYDGYLTKILSKVSFAGVEVGSVTARAYEGNTKPRLRRLKKSQSILVNKGLKNKGVDSIVSRLSKNKKEEGFVVGVSVAKTNCKECVDTEGAIEDYIYSLRKLNDSEVGDYYTINISCPNAFGGESFTTPLLLRQLLGHVNNLGIKKPLYIKMPINLSWSEIQKLLDVVMEYGISGVIIGNLNKDYTKLSCRKEVPGSYQGGLSGLPCREISTDLIKKTRKYCGNNFTIIGCGGILSPQDALEKLHAGANLLQLVTGMIYTGPHLMKNICQLISKENDTKSYIC